MESHTLTEDGQYDVIAQNPDAPVCNTQELNTQEPTTEAFIEEPSTEESATQESTIELLMEEADAEDSIAQGPRGHSYGNFLAGGSSRNILGNVYQDIQRVYNLIHDNVVAEKEFRLKIVLGLVGFCLFLAMSIFGLYKMNTE